MSIVLDDTDSSIVYSGSWSVLTGNSRAHQSTVHSTTQTGASMTIKFHGTRIAVFQVVPMGDGTETVNSNFDGNTWSISKHSHTGMSYFQDPWFDSGTIAEDDHTLILTNGGGAADTPFQLDSLQIDGSVIRPSSVPASVPASVAKTVTKTALATTTVVSSSFSSSSSSTASSSASTSSSQSLSSGSITSSVSSQSLTQTSGDKTVTAIQYITTSAAESVSTSTPNLTASSTSKPPTGAIAGAVVGLIVLILLVLLGICLRRRRLWGRHAKLAGDGTQMPYTHPRRPTSVTPYDIENNVSSGNSPIRSASQEMAYGSNSRSLAISASNMNLLQSPSEPNLVASADGTSDTNHTTLSEKNHDYFNNWTSPSSDIYASPTTAPISEAHSSFRPVLHSTTLAASRNTQAVPYRPRYLSGDTLAAPPNHIFGSSALVPIDSTDIPPSYQSVKSRNSNVPAGPPT